ncbi:MAG: hypothetical protein JWN74_103 [Acidobacteriaceae bacterium]|nr:hypothetical protein [Acidobacteriaceae bacterium]
MKSEKLSIQLLPSIEDEPLRSAECQAALAAFAKELQANGMNPSMGMHFQESAESHSFLLGSFSLELGKVIVVPICTAAGIWLHAKYGRKVRLKIGETEAEGQTVEEVKQLLEYAKQHKNSN